MTVTLTVVLRCGTVFALRFDGESCEEDAFTMFRQWRKGGCQFLLQEQPDGEVAGIMCGEVAAMQIGPVEDAA